MTAALAAADAGLRLTEAIPMLIPWSVSWLFLGASWTAVGCVLGAERSRRPGTGWRVS